jgi:hypothetical protein
MTLDLCLLVLAVHRGITVGFAFFPSFVDLEHENPSYIDREEVVAKQLLMVNPS